MALYTVEKISSRAPPRTDVGINDSSNGRISFLRAFAKRRLKRRSAKTLIKPQTLDAENSDSLNLRCFVFIVIEQVHKFNGAEALVALKLIYLILIIHVKLISA